MDATKKGRRVAAGILSSLFSREVQETVRKESSRSYRRFSVRDFRRRKAGRRDAARNGEDDDRDRRREFGDRRERMRARSERRPDDVCGELI